MQLNTQTLTVSTCQPFVLITWEDALREHLQSLRLARRSQVLALQHIRLFATWYEAQFNRAFDPQSVTHYALATYRAHSLNEARVSAATWNSRHWALGILCAWSGCTSAMGGIELKEQIQQSEAHRRLTDAEYHRLHETLERHIASAFTTFEYRDRVRDQAAVLLMNEAGLRVDEVSQLDKTDITLHERSGVVLVRSGKGDKQRKVPLNNEVRKALSQWLELRGDDNPALFDGKSTLRLSTRSIQRIITDLRAATGIPDLICHNLRFDFAKRTEKRLIAQGYGRSEILRIIRDLLGHRSTETTEIYLRSSFEELLSAVGEVE